MWLRVVSLYVSVALAWYRGPSPRARESGQSMVEYAIIAALIAVISMAAIQALGGGVVVVFERILAHIQGIGA